jgi:hypothetical protein
MLKPGDLVRYYDDNEVCLILECFGTLGDWTTYEVFNFHEGQKTSFHINLHDKNYVEI